jgi:hypothetical protein
MSVFLYNAAQETLSTREGRRKFYSRLSDGALDVLELIGHGGLALRRSPGGMVELIDLPGFRGPRNPDGTPLQALRNPVPIALAVYRELLRHNLITALTRKGKNQRTGWEEMGLEGQDGSEFYLLTQ